MEHKSKKSFSLLLVAAMAAASLAGCGSGASTPPTPGPGDGVSQASAGSQTNADRERVKIEFTMFGNTTDDVEGMKNDPIKKIIEDTVNIDLKYTGGSEGFMDSINTRMATNDAPELFMTMGDPATTKKYIADGSVWDLGAIVNKEPDRYPVLNKVFHDPNYQSYNKLYSGDENKTYALYSIAAFQDPSFPGVPVYNTAILNEINGGKAPATVDEFVAFTKAAAEKGYIGWWPKNRNYEDWGEIDKTIAAPYGTSIAPPKDKPWTGFMPTAEDPDVWKLMTTSEESKQAVKVLADLYATGEKGALDKGIGIKDDDNDGKSDFCAGKTAALSYGFSYPNQFKDLYVADWKKANPDTAKPEDLTLGSALTGPAGMAKTYDTFQWMSYHWFVPVSCAYPDRVLDLVEFILSQDGQDLLFNCKDGVYRTDQGADYWNPINAPYGYGNDGRCRYVWFCALGSGAEFMTEFETKPWYESATHPVDHSVLWYTPEDAALVDQARATVSKFVNDAAVYLPPFYNNVVLPDNMAPVRQKLEEITNRYLPQMIGGQMDIDKNWPKYQAEYEAAGAADLEKAFNEAVQTAKAAA